jgi:dCMP deaminase
MRVVPAEANALHFSNRDVTGCTAYITHTPCAHCAAHLIQRGLKEVIFRSGGEGFMARWIDNYKEALLMFNEAGILVREFK